MANKFTKQANLIIILVLMVQFLYAQDYLITFSGSGQSNTVETVKVTNIYQNTRLTLSGTDTLHLTEIVGTAYLPPASQGMIVYPNPADRQSRVEFSNSRTGMACIEIYDFSGRLLIQKNIRLDAGSHSFTLRGLSAGIYLVKVNTPEQTYSQRLVSTSVQRLAPELQYEGITKSRQQEPVLKSISNVTAMQYNDGERLVVKAISGNYAHIKSLVPAENQYIDFEFIECLDVDGNHYSAVTIGEQVWMAENLKTTHYKIGTPIQYPGNNNSAWQNDTTGAYAWYGNDLFWNVYGALYNWYAVNNPNGLCPNGWYVPDDEEWAQVIDYVVAQGYPNQAGDPDGAGNALKSCRQMFSPLGGLCNVGEHPRWDQHALHYGFDAFGFSALPGGNRYKSGFYGGMGNYCGWWSSTEASADHVWYRHLSHDHGNMVRSPNEKALGFSVRCIKN